MISLLLFGGLLAFTSGSKILFEANPDVIQSNLTQSLSMRCSLNDTADAFVGGVVGRRDVTQTASNMQVVTSLVITRNNGEHVATIYGQQPAKALADLATLTVDGALSGAVGERGYIELTWQPPSSAQVGEYVCEINAVDNQGHNVVFSTSAEIGERQPTIGELTHHILDLQKEQVSPSKLDEILKNLTQIEILYNNTPTIEPPHSEVGIITCGNSRNWNTNENYVGVWPAHFKIVHQNFNTSYATPPNVKIGVVSVDHENNANVRYEVTTQNVNTAGFDVKCETWGQFHGYDQSHLYQLRVSWISTNI